MSYHREWEGAWKVPPFDSLTSTLWMAFVWVASPEPGVLRAWGSVTRRPPACVRGGKNRFKGKSLLCARWIALGVASRCVAVCLAAVAFVVRPVDGFGVASRCVAECREAVALFCVRPEDGFWVASRCIAVCRVAVALYVRPVGGFGVASRM